MIKKLAAISATSVEIAGVALGITLQTGIGAVIELKANSTDRANCI